MLENFRANVLKLILDMVTSSTDFTTRWVDVFLVDLFLFRFYSSRFKAKENVRPCGDVFFDILMTSKEASALAKF